MEPSATKLHLKYVIGILVAINILILTINWGGLKDVVSYVSFAATLASLLLAILAIVYSYTSSGSLISYSDRISKAGEDLNKTYHQLQHLLGRVDTLCDSIPESFADLKKQVTSTNDYLDRLSTNRRSVSADAPDGDFVYPISVKSFVNNASPNGLFSILFCIHAKNNNKTFSLSEIAKIIDAEEPYIYGWLMAIDSAGLIDIDTKTDKWKVNFIEEFFTKELILETIDNRIKQEKGETPDFILESLHTAVDAIDSHFSKLG